MDLHSHQPYWLIKNGILNSYPSLQEDIHTDIAIIGAGISGALIAYHLCHTGHKVTVIDRRHAGMGSTAASTALLQYEIDTPLTKLSNMVSPANAVRSYQLCKEAIYALQDICKKIKTEAHFRLKPSMQYASYAKDVEPLYEEYKMRKKNGFDINWLEKEDIQRLYGFDAPAAVLSKDGAEIDTYRFTYGLLDYAISKGTQVYDNTAVTDIDYHSRSVTLRTANGHTIKAKKVIMACGYESLQYIPKKVADIHSTYALVSEPMDTEDFWYKNSLVWETANPYLYFRITGKNRILIGGKDDSFYNPKLRDSRIKQKTKQLIETFNKKLPNIQVVADFSWAGAFAVTKDGLPYIGSIPERPHTYFALGFGGNGIVFSQIAAQLIHDDTLKKKSADMDIFSFTR